MKITVIEPRDVDVAYLQADCGVRYWEDAKVNGTEDTDGTLIPCRDGDRWKPLICLNSGVIEGWPQGVSAKIHYKVCDDGLYTLLDADRSAVKEIDGYVPSIMCPTDNGWGDYVIMNVGSGGVIDGWNADLSSFDDSKE